MEPIRSGKFSLPCMVYLSTFGWLIFMVNVGKYTYQSWMVWVNVPLNSTVNFTVNDACTSPNRWKKRNMSWRDHNRFPFCSGNLQRVTTVTWWMKLLFEETPRFWWFLGVFPKSMVNYCRSTNLTFNTHMHRTIWWITSKTGHMKSAFQTKHWFVWHYWMHHHSPKRLVHPRHMGNRFRNSWESATPKKYMRRVQTLWFSGRTLVILLVSPVLFEHGFWNHVYGTVFGTVILWDITCHLHCTKSYE